MARLPQPGSDSGKWGDILNEYLQQTLNNDGTLKPGAVTTPTLASGAVTSDKLAPNSVTNTVIAPGAVTSASIATNAINSGALQDNAVSGNKIMDGTISQSKLDQSVQNKLDNSTNAYTKTEADTRFATVSSLETKADSTSLNNLVRKDQLDTDASLAANDDNKIATQKAIKAFVDNKTAELITGTDTRLTDERTPKDSSVTSSKITDSAVITTKLANSSVTSEKIVDGAVLENKLSSSLRDSITTATNGIKNQFSSAQQAELWVSGSMRTDDTIQAKATNIKGYLTSNTNNDNPGRWTKLATAQLSAQYQESRITLEIVSIYDAGSAQRISIDFRQKQQDPMGQDPYISLKLFNASSLSPDDFTAITTIKSSVSTTTELWGRIQTPFTTWCVNPHTTATADGNVTWHEEQGFIETLPTGTQVKGSYLSLNTARQDPTIPINGNIYYNTSSNTFRAYQNGSWHDLLSSGGAVTSVVGKTGVVTGDQIASDKALTDRFVQSYVLSSGISHEFTILPLNVGNYTHAGGTGNVPSEGSWYVGVDLFTQNIISLPRLGHRGWIPLAKVMADNSRITSISAIAPELPACRIPRTIEKIRRGEQLNVVIMGSSLTTGGNDDTNWPGMLFNPSASNAHYKVPNVSATFAGVGGAPNQYQLAQLGYAGQHFGGGWRGDGYPHIFNGSGLANGRAKLWQNTDTVIIGCLANGGDYRLETIEPMIRKLRSLDIEVIMVTDNPQNPSNSFSAMLTTPLYVDGQKVFDIANLYGVEVADTAGYIFSEYLARGGTGIYSDSIHMQSNAPAGRQVVASGGHEVWARAIRSVIPIDVGAGSPQLIGSYDFSSGEQSWIAYGSPTSISVQNGALACQTDGSFDGVMVDIGMISAGDTIDVEFDLQIASGQEIQVGLLNGSWADNEHLLTTNGGHLTASIIANQTAGLTLGVINFGSAGTFSIDNVTIKKSVAASSIIDLMPNRAIEIKQLPPIRIVKDPKTPADSFVILPKNEMNVFYGSPNHGILVAHPWGDSSFQRHFIGNTGANDLLVVTTGQELIMAASATVGWSIIRYAEPSDGGATVQIYTSNNLVKTVSFGTVPFANEWYQPIIEPSEYNATIMEDNSSYRMVVTSGTLKVAALVALTADVSYVGPEEIRYVGTWGAREVSRSGLPGYWTDTQGSYAYYQCSGRRLGWIISGNPGSKQIHLSSGTEEATTETTGNYHMRMAGGLYGKDQVHSIKCLQNNPTGSQSEGHALHIGGAIIINDR